MGVISILLGIIAIFCFTGAGGIVANTLVDLKQLLAGSFTALNVSNTALIAVVVCIFVFIGLLVGMNLIMHGLSYNKLSKIQRQLKQRYD